MDLIKLLGDLKAAMDALQAQLADAQAAAQSAYDQGFADGKASVAPGGPSQADLDAANAKIADLQKQVDGLNAQVAAFPDQMKAAIQGIKDAAKSIIDGMNVKVQGDEQAAKDAIDAL